MPLGFERLNARQRSPNDRIVFIKPLEGPDKATSQDFLERIAAICAPIMKANYLSVASLEEYEPNREFWGRNFNAGEVIQLVLKSPSNGRWLPFRFVQLVMMHELAHCKQMNHSGAFWKVRNEYTGGLKALWAKGYTGDGLWGKGQALYSGQYTQDTMPPADQMPQHLCGGVYRSGRGKRKRKPGQGTPELSYAERKQKRIEKKFGTGGLALGQDEEKRVKLENGKTIKGKPRVAGSARGRELRAAAALARFRQANEAAVKQENTESETESEYDEDPGTKEEAVDASGKKILDSKGNGLIKVCNDEDVHDNQNAQQELEELGQLGGHQSDTRDIANHRRPTPGSPAVKLEEEDISTASESEGEEIEGGRMSRAAQLHLRSETTSISKHAIADKLRPKNTAAAGLEGHASGEEQRPSSARPLQLPSEQVRQPERDQLSACSPPTTSNPGACPVCSLDNVPDTLTCAACANVLHPDKLPNHWRCKGSACLGGQYINSGDNGLCGLCGAPKATAE